MHVKVLEYIEYPPGGGHWRSQKLRAPSLNDIESAIRRLDQHQFPLLYLWPSDDDSEHDLSGSHDAFEIMGGKGAYWLAGTFDGYFQRRLDDPDGGDHDVTVWTSDQGFADADRHISHDIEAVIMAAKHYAQHGGFEPSLVWESRP